jgi:hypothetical protein
MMQPEYDDNYSTCKETSAVFRIVHDMLQPPDITAQINLTPTRAWRKGEPAEWRGRPARTGMWMLDTEGTVLSRDLRRHLDWLITQLQDKHIQLDELRQQGYSMDVFCHWVQLGGTGGPTLSVRNMQGLAALSLELGFEFWSENEDSDDEEIEP